MVNIVEATPDKVPVVRQLFLEYAKTLSFDLSFQKFDSELANLPGEYSSPKGCILLAYDDSVLAGCVALRPLDGPISEMKRLYVRPQFRGMHIGADLAEAVIMKAIQYGYHRMRLDTVPEMKSAIQLYRTMGFSRISPYRENPVVGAIYFEKILIP